MGRRKSHFLRNILLLILIILFLLFFYYLKIEGKSILEYFNIIDTAQNVLTLSNLQEIDNVIVVAIDEDKVEEVIAPPIADNNNQTQEPKIYSYFYEQLDENSKIIYDALAQNYDNMKSGDYTIDFGDRFNTLLNQTGGEEILKRAYQEAWDAYYSDRVDIFFLDSTKMYLYMNYYRNVFKTTYYVSIGPVEGKNYYAEGFYSKKQVEEALKNINDIKNIVISQVSGDEYHKVEQINDCLVVSLTYDETINRPNTRNVYGALVEREVVCEGYAKAFKYFMDELEIPCILVSGNATDANGKKEAHLLNYVEIKGKWYAVDVTWNDPIIIGNRKTTTKMMHQYLLKGSETFNKDHEIEGRISQGGKVFTYPELTLKDNK